MNELYNNLLTSLIDNTMHELSGNEFKVLLYIVRRTYGFDKTEDAIALSQFQYGIIRHDGTRLDYGTGLSKNNILRCINVLIEKGIIEKVPVRIDRRLFRPSIFKLTPLFLDTLMGSANLEHTVSANPEHTSSSFREDSIPEI